MTDQMRVSGAAAVLAVEDDTAEILIRILNSIRTLEQGQQLLLESLRDARGRLQVMEAAYLRTLDRLQRIESDTSRILVLVGGRVIHGSAEFLSEERPPAGETPT